MSCGQVHEHWGVGLQAVQGVAPDLDDDPGHGVTPVRGNPRVSLTPGGHVPRLDRLSRRALDEVVDRAHRHEPAGALVDAGADEAQVGADRVLQAGRLVADHEERVGAVGVAQQCQRVGGREAPTERPARRP